MERLFSNRLTPSSLCFACIGAQIRYCIYNPFGDYVGLSKEQKDVLHAGAGAVAMARLLAQHPQLRERLLVQRPTPSAQEELALSSQGMAIDSLTGLVVPAALLKSSGSILPPRFLPRIRSALLDLAHGRTPPKLSYLTYTLVDKWAEELSDMRGLGNYAKDLFEQPVPGNEWWTDMRASHLGAYARWLELHPENDTCGLREALAGFR